MTEVAAAMGLTSLESIAELIATNRRNYHAYQAGLAGIPGVKMFAYDEQERNNYQYIVLEIDAQQTGLSRDRLVQVLHAENILARRYFYPGCHQMEPYRSYYPHAGLLLPETEKLTQRVMTLPTGTSISVGDIEQICELIRFAFAHAPDLHRLHALA
jgi:dTDP-4-amino-4,6-dideoxygalactose transaminase